MSPKKLTGPEYEDAAEKEVIAYSKPEVPYNIILINADTYRYDNLFDRAAMPVRTPNLDKFSERAVSFSRFYTGSFPTIQAAIDALPDEGGLVRLPPGTFEITEPLMVAKSDVLIRGAGTATHIKNVNTTGKSALILQHPSGGNDRKAELWRIRLADFRITGSEKSGHGIEALRINELFIDGVTVSYHGGHGILLDHCSVQIQIFKRFYSDF